MPISRKNDMIEFALNNIEIVALLVDYVDAKKQASSRVISPIRWEGERLLAFCCLRGEPRFFDVEKIGSMIFVFCFQVFVG